MLPHIDSGIHDAVTVNGVTSRVQLPAGTLDWAAVPRVELGYRLPEGFGEIALAYRFLGSRATGTASGQFAAPDAPGSLLTKVSTFKWPISIMPATNFPSATGGRNGDSDCAVPTFISTPKSTNHLPPRQPEAASLSGKLRTTIGGWARTVPWKWSGTDRLGPDGDRTPGRVHPARNDQPRLLRDLDDARRRRPVPHWTNARAERQAPFRRSKVISASDGGHSPVPLYVSSRATSINTGGTSRKCPRRAAWPTFTPKVSCFASTSTTDVWDSDSASWDLKSTRFSQTLICVHGCKRSHRESGIGATRGGSGHCF